MHNTYLDLMFEYGLVPMLIVFILCGVAVVRMAFFPGGPGRLWLFYLVPLAVMALGQHLFFSFTHLCLMMPAFVLLARTLGGMLRPATR